MRMSECMDLRLISMHMPCLMQLDATVEGEVAVQVSSEIRQTLSVKAVPRLVVHAARWQSKSHLIACIALQEAVSILVLLLQLATQPLTPAPLELRLRLATTRICTRCCCLIPCLDELSL